MKRDRDEGYFTLKHSCIADGRSDVGYAEHHEHSLSLLLVMLNIKQDVIGAV